MVQIIQAQPTAQTLRQQAFQQGLDQIGQGVLGFANAMDQRTQREQALNAKVADQMLQSGIEFTPENIAAIKSAYEPQKPQSGFGSLFSNQAQSIQQVNPAINQLTYTPKKQAEIDRLKSQAEKDNYESAQMKLPFDQRDDFKKAVALKKVEVKSANSPNEIQFKSLPKDKQETIEVLAKKNANKISIANQIDAVMKTWDTLSDDQKVYQGRQLLKTLNSPEGADAIGSEEANRLGSNLEFALGNLTNSNPFQLGRDLEGFKEQAMGTSQSLKDAISSNKALIDEAYGRAPSKAISKTQEDELKELEILRAKKAGIK